MKNLATFVLLLSFSAVASACSFKQRSDEQLFAAATSVFRARVTEVKLASLADPANPSGRAVEVVEARYEVKEILKGAAPSAGIVRDLPFGPGNCSLGLIPGLEYVFFPGEHEMVLVPSGSFAYFNEEGSEVKPRLEALRKLAAATK